MLDKTMRSAILVLAGKGHNISEIARTLEVSRNSVKAVLKSGRAEAGGKGRGSMLEPHLELVRAMYTKCADKDGRANMVRVKELVEGALSNEGRPLKVSYTTFTWFCRASGLSVREVRPAVKIVTGPGEEMQHDTSPYTIKLGGRAVKRQCASLVLGYSRMIYMQIYPRFDRFQMKVFLTDAFRYFGGVCGRCVIDNTSVALACGSGARAQMAPEVESFEERYGFRFLAHEVGDCDRKGKIERPFHYIEHNFLVGREFHDDADLNRQAAEWVEAANRRRLRELKATPVELFALEQTHLRGLPLHVPEVYRLWTRSVDAYGCVSLHGQKYPVLAGYIGHEVQLREMKDLVIVVDGHKELVRHLKKIEGSPQPPAEPLDAPIPRRQKTAKLEEESKLREQGVGVSAYLELLKTARGARYFWSVRRLWQLACRYKSEEFIAAVARAREHRLFDVNRIETILLQGIARDEYLLPLGWDSPAAASGTGDGCRDGAVTPKPDISGYIPEPEDGGTDDAR
jgi:transposase